MLAADLVGEQSIVADAVKAIGQDMQEKASDKLVRGQGHGLMPIALFGTIVFPLEGDTLLIKGDQTTVGDRHPMGVARQIGEYGLGTGKRTFGIDHPRVRCNGCAGGGARQNPRCGVRRLRQEL